MTTNTATARAHSNIALAKYWGKADVPLNLPAVPSISLTLAPLLTATRVTFSTDFKADSLSLDGQPANEKELRRAAELLQRVRLATGQRAFAAVESSNNFPTAAGLASSASGFCALAAAAFAAAGGEVDLQQVSAFARQSSASAARSVYGGLVELPVGQSGDAELAAVPLYGPDYWDLRIVVAVTAQGRKAVGSTEGMGLTEATSPYYRAWVESAPVLAERVRQGLASRDLCQVGEAMEQSTLAMHACAMAAHPGLIYFQPATLAAISAVRRLREEGVPVYFTADAGPHVKALCTSAEVERVKARLEATDGVLRTMVATPGVGVQVQLGAGS